MKKTYQSPRVDIYVIVGGTHLMGGSIQVNGTDKVGNTSDIGFTKVQSSNDYDVWKDDWSKE